MGESAIFNMDFLEAGELLGGRKFNLVIADPPYNIRKTFADTDYTLPLPEYVAWTKQWLDICMQHLTDDGLVYVYGYPEILAHTAVLYHPNNQRWLVWHYTNKNVPGLGFWQRSHESVLCLWRGDRPRLLIDQIREDYTPHYRRVIGKPRRGTRGRFTGSGKETVYGGHEDGAQPRDVLKIPALAGGAGRKERHFLCRDCDGHVYPPEALPEHAGHDIMKHPTQKPLELTRRLMLSCMKEDEGSVLIPFAGSGSECVAARSLGLDFFACELNPEYADFGNRWLASL